MDTAVLRLNFSSSRKLIVRFRASLCSSNMVLDENVQWNNLYLVMQVFEKHSKLCCILTYSSKDARVTVKNNFSLQLKGNFLELRFFLYACRLK